jgi:ankyrin repeat protein/serine/threonine protein kinase
LIQACASEPEMRQEVESLLAAHEQARGFMNTGAASPPRSSLPVEKPGDRIGRYKLLEQIGEGGFGVVWMAEQEEPVRRRVALKIIKLGMETKEVVARFEAERQALALMDHPNIAIVLDGGATDTGRPFFVMELVKGVPLTEYCDANKLSTRERLELFQQVCQAVQHAHQKGVIHRDLKPSNILVTVKDDRPVPKVIDFGVAKATQAVLTGKTVFTRFHQWIGTPAYMSPEQAGLGSLDVDTRSDVYSLGVLLYELLTGRPPFDTQKLLAAGYDAVMRTIREEEPPKPSTRLSTLAEADLGTVAAQRGAEPGKLGRLVRGDLDWIVMKALEKDRQRRYETATALAEDVARHLRAEPVSAAAPSLLYRTGKFVRRNRTQLAFAALAGVAVVLAVAGVKFARSSHLDQQAFQATGTNAVFTLARSGDAKALTRLLAVNPLLVNQRDAEGSTPLIYAAGVGNTNTLPLLIARGATVDATNHTGLTALGNATANNRTVAALMLIAAGADPNHAESSGTTPLHAASWFGSVEVGRALLAKGARTDALSRPARLSALGQAAMAGHAAFVALLLSSGASVETCDASGQTPLHLAALGQNTTGIVRLWKEKLETLTRRGLGDESLALAVQEMSNRVLRLETALPAGSLQCGGEHPRVAEALLAHGAALEATNHAGRTPLWIAAQFTNEAVAQVLIAHHANLNARDADGLTPLHVAVARASRPLVVRLLDAGADPNQRDWAGFTPLHTAVEHDLRDLAEVLLLHRADPNLGCSSVTGSAFMGQAPLHTAAVHGNLDLIRLLLDHRASIFPRTGIDSPLAWAVKGGHPRAVELLLVRGAQANLNDPQSGMTALHWAALLGQVESATLLLDHGASNNVVSQSGVPLHYAVVGREGAGQLLSWLTKPASTNMIASELPRGTERDYAVTVKLLLARGADVEARDQAFQRTPLFSAIRAGNLPAVETLLAAGAKVDARDTVGTTPLHAASESRASSEVVSNIVVRLLQAGAAPDARDDRQATPLHAAAIGGRPEVAARLIAAGASVNAQGPFLATPLHCAVQLGNRPLVELLLANGADLERRNSAGNTALHVAVCLKSRELVALLLDHAADVNAAQPDGTTPLALAADLGDAEVFHLLCEHQAKLDLTYLSGGTLLHVASAGGSIEIVKYLLECGAELDRTDRNGDTALMIAAKFGRLELVKFFLEKGASLNEGNRQGFTLLHMAADHGHAELVEFFLGRGLDVNARSATQYTPLHSAANGCFTNEVHYLAVLKVLLAHGADVNARMQGDQTPLHRAAGWGRPQILQALLAAGADPTARDADGKTALDIAKVSDETRLRAGVGAGRKECEKLLREAAHETPK